MKNLLQSVLILVILFTSFSLFAQQSQPIIFANGALVTGDNVSRQSFKIEDLSKALFQGNYYVVVQFDKLPSQADRLKLHAEGLKLDAYFPGQAYLTAIGSQFDFKRAKQLNISSINIIPAAYKIDQKINQYSAANTKGETQLLAITYFAALNKKQVQTALEQAGAKVVPTRFDDGNTIFIQVNTAIVNRLAALPFISTISLQNITDKTLNYNSIAAHGVSGLNALTGKNLNGKGVTIGVGDNANIETHIDFTGRLINRNPTIVDTHGTHTSGTVAGAGIINVKNHGMAPKATIISQYYSDIIVNTPTYITDYNMVASNNSYHSDEAGCIGEGAYNVLSNYVDKQMARNKEVLHVFASGNDGGYSCSPYPAGFGTVKSGWQTSKNVLTVGALNTQDYSIGGFSSRGPVKDGRIKPEICSGGVSVVSTLPYNGYGSSSGTSMACPAVAGASALLYERYRQLNGGNNPKAALIKNLLCNTAEDLGNAGPDFTFGFGMLNARRAVAAMENNQYFINSISNGNNNAQSISIPANTKRLKIMLYWADSAAAISAGNTLVNDLDVTVLTPSSVLHRPLTLNSTPANVNSLAAEATDHINNIEQVTIENPAAGNYTVNVTGFNIPFGPQEYIISYEILAPAITVEYPFGGETLVPGETEVIRWNAYDDNTNTFTLEYSTNNGSNWTIINNAVSATTRVFSWTVPATATNTALVRVSRNNTAISGQSAINFTILGQPVLSTTIVCEGAVQLDWPAITGAASYDIVQLVKDSMQVVGNSSSNTFLLTGLDKNNTYWLGIAAKNGSVSGRRSVSVKVQPAGGACTLAIFNNDVKVDAITEPNTARQLFLNAADATKPVKIAIKNLSTAAVSGPFNVSYSYDGNIITEVLNTTIAANGLYTYTFSGMYPLPTAGYRYNFKAWITKSTDANHGNDTAYKTVQSINNDAITITPFVENFEAMPAIEILKSEMAIGGNNHLDFTASTTRGRARTFVNSGFAFGGTRALTLDQTPYNDLTNTDSAIFNYNLSALSNNQLRFDFYYKNHGQYNDPGNRVWIRGSENDIWLEAYNLFDNQANLGDWKKAIININEVLETALPAQTATATFQIKLGQEGNTSANNPYPVVDIDDGYTFDNLVLDKAINDVSVTAINSPDNAGCALVANSAVSIKIKNYNNAVLNNLLVSYQINGGTIVTENIASIASNQSLDYAFTQLFDFSAYIDYNINVWVKYAGDSYAANDSILNYAVHNSPVINSYPYLQTFEKDNGFFYAKGTNSSWDWGTPASTIINKAPNGTKAWVTNLSGNYNDNETSYLISPCFDVSGLQKPVLSFSHIYDVELDYDFTWVEYSTDGKLWQKLGTKGSGTNWYDNAGANNWRVSNKKWHVASYDLPIAAANIRFRFVLSSDAGVTQEGIGIDDVRVHEKSLIAGTGGTVYAGTVTGGWGINWVPIKYTNTGGDSTFSIAEINSNGQDLGTVTLQPYINYTGAVRSTNDQYYLDQNFVIQSTIAPTGNVGVRLYFTDSSANALINATGCIACGKPADAYELGITKYKSNPAEENGTLADNFNGYYQFILPANTAIYPHGNGYYAEFTANKLGECWLGKAQITPALNTTCAGTTVTYTVPSGSTTYQWQVNDGTGFVNISNGGNYTGSNTNSLQISGAPTSFSGYKYRCIINGVNGTENLLRFNNSWSGAIDSNWFNTGNWSCAVVPDQYSDVVIPSGLTKYPVINTNTAIRTIRILNGASVNVNPGIVVEIKGK
jgi:hypothetical protein